MRNKFISYFLVIISLISILSFNVFSQGNQYTVGELEELIDGIVAWKIKSSGSGSARSLIDGNLTEYAGVTPNEWYILALKQYSDDYNYDKYVRSLNSFIENNKEQKATDLQRIALTCSALGVNDEFIISTINNATGKLGIMSYAYGLLLLDCRDYEAKGIIREEIIENIISLQLPEGGWALSGNTFDPDVTAMAIQALAPYYSFDIVKKTVDKSLDVLSQRQLDTGDYYSWGLRNPETPSQVISALCALGIDPRTDSRFIKNGNTLLDGLMLYRKGDGGFSHTLEGESNNTSSAQVLCSLVALWRFEKGLGTFYKFNGNFSEQENSEPPKTQTPDDTTNTKNENTNAKFDKIAYLIIISAAVIGIIILLILKKLSKRNILSVFIIVMISVAVVAFTDIQSKDEYYLTHIDDIKKDSKTVFLSIRCDEAIGVTDKDYLPKDGVILQKTEYVLRDGDSVFDILSRAVRFNKIHMEYSGSEKLKTVYIEGINYLYEADCGETSGWVYIVNDELQSVGCSDYNPKDGDKIEWVYSLNYGQDVSSK